VLSPRRLRDQRGRFGGHDHRGCAAGRTSMRQVSTYEGAAYVVFVKVASWAEQQKPSASQERNREHLVTLWPIDGDVAAFGTVISPECPASALSGLHSSSAAMGHGRAAARSASGNPRWAGFGVDDSDCADTYTHGEPESILQPSDSQRGARLCAERRSWRLQQTLRPSGSLSGDNFGESVAIWGDTAVVSALVFTRIRRSVRARRMSSRASARLGDRSRSDRGWSDGR
jgi:hypothetical protein